MCRQDIVYDKKIKLRSTDSFLTAMIRYCIYRSCMELPHESPVRIKCINIPGRPDGSSIYVSEKEDYMFYALLNGGAPYLMRDGAYPNTDGQEIHSVYIKPWCCFVLKCSTRAFIQMKRLYFFTSAAPPVR